MRFWCLAIPAMSWLLLFFVTFLVVSAADPGKQQSGEEGIREVSEASDLATQTSQQQSGEEGIRELSKLSESAADPGQQKSGEEGMREVREPCDHESTKGGTEASALVGGARPRDGSKEESPSIDGRRNSDNREGWRGNGALPEVPTNRTLLIQRADDWAPLVFVHIPKCAGGTYFRAVRELLASPDISSGHVQSRRELRANPRPKHRQPVHQKPARKQRQPARQQPARNPARQKPARRPQPAPSGKLPPPPPPQQARRKEKSSLYPSRGASYHSPGCTSRMEHRKYGGTHCGFSELKMCLESGRGKMPGYDPKAHTLDFFTMVRDPVVRAVSEYFWWAPCHQQAWGPLLCNKGSFEAWLRSPYNTGMNRQVKYLVSLDSMGEYHQSHSAQHCVAYANEPARRFWAAHYNVTEAATGDASSYVGVEDMINRDRSLLENAKRVIEERFLFVGVAERLGDSLEEIARYYGKAIPGAPTAHLHASKSSQQKTNRLHSESLRAEIRSRNALDVELYEWVLDRRNKRQGSNVQEARRKE